MKSLQDEIRFQQMKSLRDEIPTGTPKSLRLFEDPYAKQGLKALDTHKLYWRAPSR